MPLMVICLQLETEGADDKRRGPKVATLVLDARVAVELLEEQVRLDQRKLEPGTYGHRPERTEHRQRVSNQHVDGRH